MVSKFILFVLFILTIAAEQIKIAGDKITPVTPTRTPTFIEIYYESFPHGLSCSDIEMGAGPSWFGVKIGQTTLDEFEERFGETQAWLGDMLFLNGGQLIVFLCVEDNVITALKGGAPLRHIADYVALYGIPDAVTYSDAAQRVAFWFKEGIAIGVYINRAELQFYGNVNFAVYFPFQNIKGYETRWPYNTTLHQNVFHPDATNVSNEQNPFDFDMMILGMTATAVSTRFEPIETATPSRSP